MTTILLDGPSFAVSPRPTLSRIAVEVGDVLLVAGQPRRVCGVAAALDGTRDLDLRGAGRVNYHRYRRVSVVG